jgi:hypothetical protein
LLVEAEARLERAIAAARAQAGLLEQAARARIARAEADLDAELAAIRASTIAEVERATADRVRVIEDDTHEAVARCEAVRGNEATRIARGLAGELVALVTAEVPL